MPRRPGRVTALVAVLALLMAAPALRPSACDVCPSDCPMHAARRAAKAHLGCHQSGAHHAGAPADSNACAMRATCGHHGQATLVVFQGVVPTAVVTRPVIMARAVVVADTPRTPAPGLEPPAEPPESRSV